MQTETHTQADRDCIHDIKENTKKLRSLAKYLNLNEKDAVEVAVGAAWVDINDLREKDH